MLSLKRYLNMPDGESGQEAMFTLLLNTIATRLPSVDAARLEGFSCSIRKLQLEIVESSGYDQTTLAGVRVAELIDQYSRALESTVQDERRELKSIVGMLTQTLLQITKASQNIAPALYTVEQDLRAVCELPELRAIKANLASSLKLICETAASQQVQAPSFASQPGSGPGNSSLVSNDPITGLPSLEGAQERIHQILREGRRAWLALFFVERLTAVNQRFGFQAGDRMILLFSQHIVQQLRSLDQLFRWRGPLFVALLERSEAPVAVGAEVRRVTMARFEYSVNIGKSQVIVPISATYSVIPIKYSSTAEALFAAIDSFASSEQNRNPALHKPARENRATP